MQHKHVCFLTCTTARSMTIRQYLRLFMHYYVHYFNYYAHYFHWLSRNELGETARNAQQLNLQLFQVQCQAKESSGQCSSLLDAHFLCCFETIMLIIRLLCRLFWLLYALSQNPKLCFGSEFIAENSPIVKWEPITWRT